MSCKQYFKAALEAVDSGLVLLGVTVYRMVIFMIFLSASIAPSVLMTRLYDAITGLDALPEALEAMICMILIRCWAEFAVGIEPQVCGASLTYYRTKYPNTMIFGRFTVNMFLYLFAISQLYIQFEESHSLKTSSNGKDNNEDSPLGNEEGLSGNEGLHTALFLLCLSYLVFTTSKTFHKAVIRVVENVPAPHSILSNCMIRMGYAILHVAVNVIYFMPCLAIAFTARTYRTPGHATYFQLTCTAAMSGMIAALFELNKPWPRQRGSMPFLHFENNMIAKDKLTLLFVGLIILSYYRPFKHGKVPESVFDSTNYDLINFCVSVSFTVLHVVKFGVHAILTLAQDYDQDRALHGLAPLPPFPDVVPDQDDNSPGSVRSSSSATRQGLESCQMCQRSNGDNNNNGHSVAPDADGKTPNNNDEPRQPPQEDQEPPLGEEKTEVTLLVEQNESTTTEESPVNNNQEEKVVVVNEIVEIEMTKVEIGKQEKGNSVENNTVNIVKVDLKQSPSQIV